MRVVTILFTLFVACSSSDEGDACAPDDQDGIVGVDLTAAVTVNDDAFAPAIIKAQNESLVSLTFTNAGTRPHGFIVDCLPTPNARGCPTQSCFPDSSTILPIAPGASATVKFSTPAVEGIYTYRSQADGDTAITTGQFILQ